MGFFSKVRKRIKKIIPKEIRPFIPYAAALIPGGMGLTGGLAKFGGSQFLKAGIARALTDDEADLKDILRTGAFAAAPTALDAGIGSLDSTQGIGKFLNTAGKGKDATSIAEKVSRFSDPSGFDAVKAVGASGALDASIKAAELNEDALDKYNRDLEAQGINDKAGRRAAIRAIYSNTGTWDMDEVDGMLDTYGYRTGGRVGYAIGDIVDTEQITEDLGRAGGAIKEGIGNLVQMNKDSIDTAIDYLFSLPGPLKSGKEIIQILVERYGVDPRIAQRKVINRMSDSNEGFGSQGLDGTPDDGYNPNIGIDSGAEDYYGETPAMPENLGDMGGSMDDMSGSMGRRRGRGGLDDLIEQMPDMPRPVPMPTPDMPRRPDGREFMPVPMPRFPERMPEGYEFLNSGGRVGYDKGGSSDDGYITLAERDADSNDGFSMIESVKRAIGDEDPEDDEETKKEKRRKRRDKDEDLGDNIEMAIDGYNRLYPEIKAQPIRPLSFEDGGSVDDRLMERVKELQDEGLDFASALAQAMKEDMAANKARGGIMDGIDINMEEQIDTPRGDIMIDENIEVADSSLMDAYEIYKFDMMEQGLEPMSIEEFREQAIAESKMASMEEEEEEMSPFRDYRRDVLQEEEVMQAANGGLMNLGGREMDLRGGGFVPMGAKERADDVPARLSKNEFVMTADAVRAAGGGSVQKGADLMYDQMKQLEGQA